MLAYTKKILHKSSDESPEKRARDLQSAFKLADEEAEHESLYGAFIETIINSILDKYIWARTQNIRNGTVYQEWTQTKIESLDYLREKIAETIKEPKSGEEMMADLAMTIETDFDEYLSSKRKAFMEKHNRWEPPLGALEKTYLPAIVSAIQIVYHIFALFQIENFTSETKLPHLKLAHKMAKLISEQLLKDFSKEAMDRAAILVKEFDQAYAQSKEKTCVGSTKSEATSTAPGLNPTDLHCAISICVEKLRESDLAMQAQASEHLVPRVKAAINGAIETGSLAVGAAGSAAQYLKEKALDYCIGSTQGPSSHPSSITTCEVDEDSFEVTSPEPTHTGRLLRLSHSPGPEEENVQKAGIRASIEVKK